MGNGRTGGDPVCARTPLSWLQLWHWWAWVRGLSVLLVLSNHHVWVTGIRFFLLKLCESEVSLSFSVMASSDPWLQRGKCCSEPPQPGGSPVSPTWRYVKTSTSCSAPATDLALGFLLGTSPNATSRVTLGLVTPPFFHYCLLFLSCTFLTQPFHLKSGCCHLSGHVPPLDTALWGSCSCPVFPAALPTLPQDFHLPDHLWCLHPRSPLGASHEDLAWFPCQCPHCAQPGLVPPVSHCHTQASPRAACLTPARACCQGRAVTLLKGKLVACLLGGHLLRPGS